MSVSFKFLIFFLTPFVGCAVGNYRDSTNLTAQKNKCSGCPLSAFYVSHRVLSF